MIIFVYYMFLFFFGKNIQYFICKYKLVNPEIWSFLGDINNFNVALPDSYATYRGSFICLLENEEITIISDIPNSTYYSFQIYDHRAITLSSLNDEEIIIKDNKMYITISKNKESSMIIKSTNSFFVLLYRNYYENEIPTLPKIYKTTKILTTEIDKSNYVPNLFFPNLFFNIKPFKKFIYSNTDNNFFKSRTNSFFSNKDASYLLSTIVLNETKIGAIITGILPITYYENKTNYDVRYISFNVGIGSFPLPTIGGNLKSKNISSSGLPGINDRHIINNFIRGREYKIYVGIDHNHINEMGEILKMIYIFYFQDNIIMVICLNIIL